MNTYDIYKKHASSIIIEAKEMLTIKRDLLHTPTTTSISSNQLNPQILSETLVKDSTLKNYLKHKLNQLNYRTLAPVQQLSLIDSNKHRVFVSPTGSGKTLSFILPLLNNTEIIENSNDRNTDCCFPKALIITPTRELCSEIYTILQYLSPEEFVIGRLMGGHSYDEQSIYITNNADFIVACPGRLLDYIQKGKINVSKIEYLVVDECDEMLKSGFDMDLKYICEDIPSGIITLTSATMPDSLFDKMYEILKLENASIHKLSSKVKNISKHNLLYAYNKIDKYNDLIKLLDYIKQQSKNAIIFRNVKTACEALNERLKQDGYLADLYTADRNQTSREDVVKRFKCKQTDILVCSDLAFRGLNLDVDVVINYDLPSDKHAFTHRVGRTGRCGKEGITYSFAEFRSYKTLTALLNQDSEGNKDLNFYYIDPKVELLHKLLIQIETNSINENLFKTVTELNLLTNVHFSKYIEYKQLFDHFKLCKFECGYVVCIGYEQEHNRECEEYEKVCMRRRYAELSHNAWSQWGQ